jgi:hypothetical protein
MSEFSRHRFVYHYTRQELDGASMQLYHSRFSGLSQGRQNRVRKYLREALGLDKSFVANKGVEIV